MKKSPWAIVSLSFCVGALLIVSGFLLVKYKTTDNSMITADGYFYLTYGHKKPIEGNINEGIGEIRTVGIPYRQSRGLNYWEPLVTIKPGKYESIRSGIVKRFTARGLNYWAPLVTTEPGKYESIRSGIVKRFTARWPSRYSKNIQWKGFDLVSQKKSQFFLQRY